MRNYFFCSCFLFLVGIPVLMAQDDWETLVREGIQFHDAGEYEQALEKYQEALKLAPGSGLIFYEMAFSYDRMENHKQAVKYASKAIKVPGSHVAPAYILKGSALDDMGKSKKAIKVFEEAIAIYEGVNLLHYNMALTLYRVGNYPRAEEQLLAAIDADATHPSSHWLLAGIHREWRHPARAALANYFFLMLEPESERASERIRVLEKLLAGNVSQNADDPLARTITITPDESATFGAASLMLSMMAITRGLEAQGGKSEAELWAGSTETFLTFMGEMSENEESAEEKEGIWWELYVPFFYQMIKEEQIETFAHYIRAATYEDSQAWLEEHPEALDTFIEWFQD